MDNSALNKISPEIELGLLNDCILGKITQNVCANLLGLSVRQIKRKCKGIRITGSIEHGNKGRSPVNRISDKIRKQIVQYCNENFKDFGPTLVRDEYKRMHNVDIAVETVRQIMINNDGCQKRRQLSVYIICGNGCHAMARC